MPEPDNFEWFMNSEIALGVKKSNDEGKDIDDDFKPVINATLLLLSEINKHMGSTEIFTVISLGLAISADSYQGKIDQNVVKNYQKEAEKLIARRLYGNQW